MGNSTTQDEFSSIYSTLRETFGTGRTKSLKWRKFQLKQLFWLLQDNEQALVDSLSADLHRHEFESLMSDIEETKIAILEALKHIEEWSRGQAPSDAGYIYGTLGKAWIRKEPRGVVLIIGAWNYPISTLLTVGVAAIAAGNSVIFKPSEMAPSTEQLLATLIPKYMDTSAISIVRANPNQMGFVLEHQFDFIFYTGSTRVGRIIAAAAAKHVTPTALELGGQAPAIVTRNANIDIAAKRLINAKLSNLGQICICVNHVFVDPEVHDELVSRLAYWANHMLADGFNTVARIVNEKHFDRLRNLLDSTEGNKTFTGKHSRDEKLIYPTVVTDIALSDCLMSEEIFGPILPVIKANVEQALQTIKSMPHPLALYIFSNNQKEINRILDSTLSGGVTVNDVALHADVHSAPFGGVGPSGYGSYHGKWGFDTFSHNRTVVHIPNWIERFVGWRYPPFDVANRSEIDAGRPNFRRGETLEDQSEYSSIWSKIPIVGRFFR